MKYLYKLVRKYKSNILSFIIGAILFSSITAYAAIVVSGSDVSFSSSKSSKTTVTSALDDLYGTSATGKTNIINALKDKGLGLTSSSSFSDIVSGINSLPIGADESGTIGYKPEGADIVKPFDSEYMFVDTTANNAIAYYTSDGKVLINSDVTGYDIQSSLPVGTFFYRGFMDKSITITSSKNSENSTQAAVKNSSEAYVSTREGTNGGNVRLYFNHNIDLAAYKSIEVYYSAGGSGTHACNFGLNGVTTVALPQGTNLTYTLDVSSYSGTPALFIQATCNSNYQGTHSSNIHIYKIIFKK